MKKQVNPKRDAASQKQPPHESRSPSNTQSRLLDGTSVEQVYVIDLETARRLGDLDCHMCWPYAADAE